MGVNIKEFAAGAGLGLMKPPATIWRLSLIVFTNRLLEGLVMSSSDWDAIDRKLLSLLQRDFPLVSGPYQELAQKLALKEKEVIGRIQGLKDKEVVRQISPVLDARCLGYQSTLIAMKMPESGMKQTEELLTLHTGVSHAYERENEFNIWFTLSLPPMANVDEKLEKIRTATVALATIALPALKLFKINAYFGADGDDEAISGKSGTDLPQRVELSPAERRVINALQQDLPLTPAPFDAIAAEAGMEVTDFLTRCQSLIGRGVIRRFGASVNHRKAGYQGNAMTCWVASSQMVDSAGRELATLPAVSHCYERKTGLLWPYNLFAMFHGDTREACRDMLDGVSHRLGLSEYIVLFSTREIKKTRVKYLV